MKAFGEGETILPGIKTSRHPGRTPGSAFFTVSSRDKSMTIIGDVIHVAAVQFPDPNVTIVYDVKPEDAASVRKETFGDLAKRRKLAAAPHLPFPGVGYVRAEGAGSFLGTHLNIGTARTDRLKAFRSVRPLHLSL